MKILATGATGQFAGLVVPALVRAGHEVRGVVHDKNKAGIPRGLGAQETVQADLRDPASLDAALDGVAGAFLITPAFAPDATELGLALIDAVHRSGVRKLVYSGVYHPSLSLENHASTRPIEAALYASDLDFTILQPAMYMQGLDGAWQQARSTGALVMPWSKRSRMTYVDYRDVAEVAALAFNDERLSYGTFELAAGGMIDRIRLAELFAAASGIPIAAEDVPAGALPSGLPEGLRAMFADYDRTGSHGGSSLVLRSILGRSARTIEDYVAELVSSS
ncbi:NmrA family NAD(P)-binding protein [Paeniglutamicibacter antarcticus]|uniref:NmrA family NAD(P)-binding protein n=1 Tax=Arthrobacter terrae TaxID=2935737 RepID=A0A931G6C3_9MICC|nr:NmrA family NAD(P)-binding protein [Arthrobacter terrae]MBG0740500.1 NmrA family NAD(P)-binding protein [Arthrobacter terrae]